MTSGAGTGWRVGHTGRDQMYYEEWRDGAWARIDIDGEMLTGRAHHVIYFASPESWQRYPAWARDRRDEIIARITSEFREPDYEYYGLHPAEPSAPPASATAPSPAPPPAARRAPAHAALPTSWNRALVIAVALLFALAAAMGWLVARGVVRGETVLPMKRASQRRTVTHAEEPATYWLSMGVYAVLGAGALTLGVLGVRAGNRR